MSLFDHHDIYGRGVSCGDAEAEVKRLRAETQRLGGKVLVSEDNSKFWFDTAIQATGGDTTALGEAMDPIQSRAARIAELTRERDAARAELAQLRDLAAADSKSLADLRALSEGAVEEWGCRAEDGTADGDKLKAFVDREYSHGIDHGQVVHRYTHRTSWRAVEDAAPSGVVAGGPDETRDETSEGEVAP